MDALCDVCRVVLSDAKYELADDQVSLVRICSEHGRRSSVVSGDVELFSEALAGARNLTDGPRLRGLVVELLDGCNLRCPTCSAASGPEQWNVQSTARLVEDLASRGTPPAVLLSGGEPTLHPRLDEFMRIVEDAGVPRRILITNGIRMAKDPNFVNVIVRRNYPWEVFLQFDSLQRLSLLDLRGADLVHVRRQALDALGSGNVPTTLVSVIKRGVNESQLAEIFDVALDNRHVVGLQLQPIRETGRVDNYIRGQNGTDLSDVKREMASQLPRSRLKPHPSFPLSILQARLDRGSGDWESEGGGRDWPKAFYCEETSAPDGRLRITVLEYADVYNWSSLRSHQCPLDILSSSGEVSVLDDQFAGLPR